MGWCHSKGVKIGFREGRSTVCLYKAQVCVPCVPGNLAQISWQWLKRLGDTGLDCKAETQLPPLWNLHPNKGNWCTSEPGMVWSSPPLSFQPPHTSQSALWSLGSFQSYPPQLLTASSCGSISHPVHLGLINWLLWLVKYEWRGYVSSPNRSLFLCREPSMAQRGVAFSLGPGRLTWDTVRTWGMFAVDV